MRKLMSYLGLGVAVAFVAVACSKGGTTSTSNNNVPEAQAPVISPVANNPAPTKTVVGTGLCEGKPTVASPDGSLQICQLESSLNLLGNVCQKVNGGGTWTLKVGIVSTGTGYFRDSTFGAIEEGCSATGVGSPGQSKGAYDKKTFPAGESTFEFTLVRDGNGCGREQNDLDAINEATGARVNVFGIVFDTEKPCATCADAKLTASGSSSSTDDAVTESVVVSFKAGVSSLPFTINWGDGVTDSHSSAGTYKHTYARGGDDKSYSITVTYAGQFQACSSSLKANVPHKSTCDDYAPPSAPNWSGSLALTNETATTETVTVGSVSPSNGTFNPSLPDTVNRTTSDWVYTTTETKVIGYGPERLECSKSFSHPFSITIPKKHAAGSCYYRVSCGASQSDLGGVNALHHNECTDQDQENICERTSGGDPSAHGVWLNFVHGDLHNHCKFTVPGVSLDNFQLNPGQSAHGCLNKND